MLIHRCIFKHNFLLILSCKILSAILIAEFLLSLKYFSIVVFLLLEKKTSTSDQQLLLQLQRGSGGIAAAHMLSRMLLWPDVAVTVTNLVSS